MTEESGTFQAQNSPTKMHKSPSKAQMRSTSNEMEGISSPDAKQMKAIVSSKTSKKKTNSIDSGDYLSYFTLAIIVLITIVTCPTDWSLENKVTTHHVWYNGWITAVATGVGVLPFFFLSSEPNKFWMGISNGKFTAF